MNQKTNSRKTSTTEYLARQLFFVVSVSTLFFLVTIGQNELFSQDNAVPPTEKKTDSPAEEIKIEVLAEKLPSPPVAIAIQPETDAVFVSMQASTVALVEPEGKVTDVIVDFANDPKKAIEELGAFDSGPLAICFTDKDRLAVGLGKSNPQVMLQYFDVSKKNEWPLSSDKPKSQSNIHSKGKFESACSIHGIGISGDYLVTTLIDEQGGLSIGRFKFDAKKLKLPRFFFSTELKVDNESPIAFNLSPRGEIVVALPNLEETDSTNLTFFTTTEGRYLATFSVPGLRDVADIAFSSDYRLFALCFGPKNEYGGLYRVDATEGERGQNQCSAKRIVELDFPIAMEFDQKGNLIVATNGGDVNESGQVLKISGLK